MFPDIGLQCVDTPNWKDKDGDNCERYSYKKWCEHGRIKEAHSGLATSRYNNPHENCCACGKPLGKPINIYLLLRKI